MKRASTYCKITKTGFTGKPAEYKVWLVVEQQSFDLSNGITRTLSEARWLKRQLVFALKKIQADAKHGAKVRKTCEKCADYCGIRAGGGVLTCLCDCHDNLPKAKCDCCGSVTNGEYCTRCA